MIPLKDDNPTTIFPWITIILIVINIVVYLAQLFMAPQAEWIFIHRFGAIPAALTHLVDPFPDDGFPVLLTPITSLFLHGGLFHLAGNMLYLWIFGNNVEEVLGRFRFILFYLICGLAATLAFVITEPASTAPLVGASGAIAGVMGAYLLLFPHAKVLTLFFIILYPILVWIPALLILVLWIFFQFINVAGGGESSVAFAAHIGGFFVGMIVLKLFRPKKPPQKPPPRRPRTPLRATRPDRYYH